MRKKVTAKNLAAVMARLTHYAIECEREGGDIATAFADDLNVFLDGLSNQDAFGTEGQNDPRGDQRS